MTDAKPAEDPTKAAGEAEVDDTQYAERSELVAVQEWYCRERIEFEKKVLEKMDQFKKVCSRPRQSLALQSPTCEARLSRWRHPRSPIRRRQRFLDVLHGIKTCLALSSPIFLYDPSGSDCFLFIPDSHPCSLTLMLLALRCLTIVRLSALACFIALDRWDYAR